MKPAPEVIPGAPTLSLWKAWKLELAGGMSPELVDQVKRYKDEIHHRFREFRRMATDLYLSEDQVLAFLKDHHWAGKLPSRYIQVSKPETLETSCQGCKKPFPTGSADSDFFGCDGVSCAHADSFFCVDCVLSGARPCGTFVISATTPFHGELLCRKGSSCLNMSTGCHETKGSVIDMDKHSFVCRDCCTWAHIQPSTISNPAAVTARNSTRNSIVSEENKRKEAEDKERTEAEKADAEAPDPILPGDFSAEEKKHLQSAFKRALRPTGDKKGGVNTSKLDDLKNKQALSGIFSQCFNFNLGLFADPGALQFLSAILFEEREVVSSGSSAPVASTSAAPVVTSVAPAPIAAPVTAPAPAPALAVASQRNPPSSSSAPAKKAVKKESKSATSNQTGINLTQPQVHSHSPSSENVEAKFKPNKVNTVLEPLISTMSLQGAVGTGTKYDEAKK